MANWPSWVVDEPRGVWRVCPAMTSDFVRATPKNALWFDPDLPQEDRTMYCPACGKQIRTPEGKVLDREHFKPREDYQA